MVCVKVKLPIQMLICYSRSAGEQDEKLPTTSSLFHQIQVFKNNRLGQGRAGEDAQRRLGLSVTHKKLSHIKLLRHAE